MSNTTPDLTSVFSKYTGQVLLDPNRMTCDMDSVIEKIRDEAAQLRLRVRVEYPDSLFTTDIRHDRLRVLVNGDAGVLKITGFKIG